MAAFAHDTGQETHGVEADPRFAAPADGNLSLTPRSPAIDNGLAGTGGSGPTDAFGGSRIYDPLMPNVGAGVRLYDDRGAYELHNPGFESNTAGWNTAGSSPQVTLSQAFGGHSGDGAATVANDGSSKATCALNDSPNLVRTTAGGYLHRDGVGARRSAGRDAQAAAARVERFHRGRQRQVGGRAHHVVAAGDSAVLRRLRGVLHARSQRLRDGRPSGAVLRGRRRLDRRPVRVSGRVQAAMTARLSPPRSGHSPTVAGGLTPAAPPTQAVH